MLLFRFAGAMRYTRWSCRPFAARWPIARLVQARDRQDALRQVGLCVHRDLEDILAQVSAINVAEVRIETERIEEVTALEAPGGGAVEGLWNPTRFPDDVELPPHIELNGRRGADDG